MGFTAYGRSDVMRAYFIDGGAPATLYLALTSVVPINTDSGTLLSAQEPTGTGYARVAYVTAGGWDEIVPGTVSNARGVQFPTPGSDWGWVRGWALCTAATAGLVVVSSPLRQVRRVTAGLPVRVYIDGLQISSR